MTEKNYPLIIVFYLDAEMMKIKDIIQPFADSVNKILAQKNANAIAFFLPTKGEERIECINPTIVAEADMEKINAMLEDIKTNFSVGTDMNVPDIDIEVDSEPCECGNNPDGKCECND